MATFNSWNEHRLKMAIKFTAYALFNCLVFEVPKIRAIFFRPFEFILEYQSVNSKYDKMWNWYYRSTLDHWACFLGMLCAYNYPTFERFMNYLDSDLTLDNREWSKKAVIRISLGLAGMAAGFVWYMMFSGAKYSAYIAVHPYVSLLPILAFVLLRNLHPVLRSYHVELFTWLGKFCRRKQLQHIIILLLETSDHIYIA